MPARRIPQRELRNDIGRVLREAEAGATFTITVSGRPVAQLGPPTASAVPSTEVGADAVRALLARTPVDADLAADIARLRDAEQPLGEPWRGG